MSDFENADQSDNPPNLSVTGETVRTGETDQSIPSTSSIENPNQNGDQSEQNAQASQNEQTGQSRADGPTPTAGPNQPTQNNQNGPIAGDVILQVHIANIFLTFCQKYARLCDKRVRRFLEFIVLLKALGAVGTLIYAHVGYPKSSSCLLPLKGKIPVESILRVEIGKRDTPYISDYLYQVEAQCPLDDEGYEHHWTKLNSTRQTIKVSKDYIQDVNLTPVTFQSSSSFIHAFMFDFGLDFVEFYRFEFSQEYGYLRLSDKARRTRNVEVINVVLDPTRDECFGSKFGRVLLYEWFGYEWIILDSIVQVSGNVGYVRNTITGEQFTVRNGTNKKRMIYVPLLACVIFTALIAMLLRFAYKQVFLFVFRVLTSGPTFDFWTLHYNFPYGAVASSVLALIGLEDIMSEYFGDSRIAFYIILNVWIADQFHSYCCHTPITKKYWIRFFYLYHFAFYAYYHLYTRRNSFMALFASCLLITHMMLYFFHHFELPFVLNTFQIRSRIRNPQGNQNPQNTLPLITDVVNDIINQSNPLVQQNAPQANNPPTTQPPQENETVDELEENVLPEGVDEYEVELHISDIEQEMDDILNTELL